MIIDFINVGFGESIVIRNGQYTILIDGGDNLASKYEHTFRTRLIDYLDHEGIDIIDLLVMTHPHRDHIGGFVDVAQHKKVKEAWYSVDCHMQVLDQDMVISDNMYQAFSMYQQIMEALDKQGTTIKKIKDLHEATIANIAITVFPTVGEEVLEVERTIQTLDKNKSPKDNYDILQVIDKKLNACSLVLRVAYERTKALFTADILASYWHGFDDKKCIEAHLLKMPHHGDATHISEAFMEQVDPTHAVICSDNEMGGLSNDRVEACVKAMTPDIQIAYTELPEHSYHTIRFLIGQGGDIEKMPYRMK